MSYRARSGSRYGDQRRQRNSSGSYYNKNRQRDRMPIIATQKQSLPSANAPESNESITNQIANFPIIIKAPATWDKTSWIIKLPKDPDVTQQAYELSALANDRKIELILNSPNNQPIKKYRLEKKQVVTEPNKEMEQIDTIVPDCLSSLKTALESFGFTLTEVAL